MDDYTNFNDLSEVVANDKTHVWHHLIQHKPFETTDPRIIVEGKGIYVWDQNGKEHLDAVSGGVWTVNVGYGRERIANAVRDQLVKMNYFAGTAGSIPGANFAAMLIDKMPGMSRVYYSNSGSEANEKAYKMVRQIAHKHHSGKKHKILYRERDYHGTTIACMGSGGHHQRNAQYGPFPPGFVSVPHCLEYRAHEQAHGQNLTGEAYGIAAANAIEDVIKREGPETVGGLILEPVTAGGGVITPPEGYWQRVQDICRKYDILLIVDEVVCGLGRTGKWFGYQNYDVTPDIVTMAKGVASGYAAISCTVTTERVFDMFKDDVSDPLNYFRDISTFGGCTAGPAAAIENMNIIEDENLLQNVLDMGDYFYNALTTLAGKHDVIGDVRGKGLFCGLELVKDKDTRTPADEHHVQDVVKTCMAQGVVIGATNRSFEGYNNTLCFSPALIATKDNIDHLIANVDEALNHVFK